MCAWMLTKQDCALANYWLNSFMTRINHNVRWLTNKIDLGGVDFLSRGGGAGSREAGGWWDLDTCHTTADDVDWFQVRGTGAGSSGGGGSHTQRAAGAGTAQGGCGGLAGGSGGGGWCLSDHTGLSGGNGLTKFGVKLHNLDSRIHSTGNAFSADMMSPFNTLTAQLTPDFQLHSKTTFNGYQYSDVNPFTTMLCHVNMIIWIRS